MLKDKEKLKLVMEVVEDWRFHKLESELAMGRISMVVTPQPKPTAEEIAYGTSLEPLARRVLGKGAKKA
jgi:hypothetical protein